MVNASSDYYLKNYELGALDIGLCLITGLTCAPYAKRHWTMSNENSNYSLGHKLIAVLECVPIIGGIIGLVERIIIYINSFFRPTAKSGIAPSKIPTLGNATALEFSSSINKVLFKALTELSEKETQEFLNRGGSLNFHK